MPNRIIREGWLDSGKIDLLDAPAERFFLRLCLKADDYGRFHATPQLLKSALFPLKEDVRGTDMTRCLAACEKAGLVRCYEVTGKRYLEVTNFDQRLRAKVSKYPPPSGECQTDDGHVSDKCQTHVSHVTARRETEVEVEVEEKPPNPLKGEAPLALPFDSDEFAEAWANWIRHRKEIRHPLKASTIQSQLKMLAKWGHGKAIAAIEASINAGWQGLFEPKIDPTLKAKPLNGGGMKWADVAPL